MDSYIEPIKTAFFVFPIIAFLFTLPYIVVHYRKYGAIPALRTIVVYSMILYLISAYFLVILPLPPVEQVLHSSLPMMQLIPFQFVADIIEKSSLVITDPSTYLKAFTNPEIYQVFYNLLLLFPFGFYLRYYFKCSWIKTIFYSFLLSLFFEVTQLTGLYGIYPRNYRLFDVDDLMINTLGGLMGFLFTPFISIFLPSRDKLDQQSYEKGKQVSYLRRLCAFGLDWMIIFITYPILGLLLSQFSILHAHIQIQYAIIILFYFVVVPMLLQGETLGKRFFKMKLIRTDDKPISWENYIVRYGIFYFFILPAPIIFIMMLGGAPGWDYPFSILYFGITALFLILSVYAFLQAIYEGMTGSRMLCYEKWSHTKNTSTIVLPSTPISSNEEEIDEMEKE